MPCARHNTFYRYTDIYIVFDLVFYNDFGIDTWGENVFSGITSLFIENDGSHKFF